jgi:hypothetical protein
MYCKRSQVVAPTRAHRRSFIDHGIDPVVVASMDRNEIFVQAEDAPSRYVPAPLFEMGVVICGSHPGVG